MNRKNYKITIGCDPEYILYSRDRQNRISANNLPLFNSTVTEIGCDGHSSTAEIRPPPVQINNLNKMVSNIKDIYHTIARYCLPQNISMVGGAYPFERSIGCHIHIGGLEFLSDKSCINKANVEKLTLLFDTLFTPIANLLYDRHQIKRRASSYGSLTEIRQQNHGFEYRTPYSFLLSPLYTRGLMGLACLISANFKKAKPDIELYKNIKKYYFEKFDEKLLHKMFPKIKDKLLLMMKNNSPNPSSNSSILTLFSLIERKRKIRNNDIFDNYRIIQPKELNTKITIKNKRRNIFNPDNTLERWFINEIRNRIRNKNNMDIEIEILKTTTKSRQFDKISEIYIPKDLPILKRPRNTKVNIYHYTIGGIPNCIQISSHYLNKISNKKELLTNLIDYFNNIKKK